MVNINLNYVQGVKSRGKYYYYYRRKGLSQRINGDFGSQKFSENYHNIHSGFDAENAPGFIQGTVGWLIGVYIKSHSFDVLAKVTKRNYYRHLDIIKEKAGKKLWVHLDPRDIVKMRDANTQSPRKANYLLTMMILLGDTAREQGIRRDNPARNIKKLKLKKSVGFRAWEPEELLWYEGAAETAKMRLAYFLGLFTGQRNSDVRSMEWNAIRGDMMEVVQEKTGATAYIPIHPILQAELRRMRRTSNFILPAEHGGKYTKDGFSSIWRREILNLGLDGCTFHGLRKNATVALAESGCSNKEIMSITGHQTDAMVSLYTRDAQQKLLARSAMRKLQNS